MHLMTAHEWWLAGAVIALAALSPAAAYLYYSRPTHRGRGRHILGRPVFDGDTGTWPAEGPTALLGLPAIDWHTAPLSEPPAETEFHADMFGIAMQAAKVHAALAAAHATPLPEPWDCGHESLSDMAEHHPDFFGAPPPKYTELDAFRAEAEASERLATTDTRYMLAAIVRGLEFRDLIDAQAALIVERALAELSIADIAADLS